MEIVWPTVKTDYHYAGMRTQIAAVFGRLTNRQDL